MGVSGVDGVAKSLPNSGEATEIRLRFLDE